jgi:hypothetical protein
LDVEPGIRRSYNYIRKRGGIMGKYTKTQVSNWLGNRGVPTPESNIKVYDRWGLVRTHDDWNGGWDAEVDCYDLASGSLYAEPWTGIKYQDSPFIPHNKPKTDAAMAKVESEYADAYNEAYPDFTLCLVATSGDCASKGMGPANEVLLFDAKHNGLVEKYLKVTMEYHMGWMFHLKSYSKSPLSKIHEDSFRRYQKATTAMRNAGIFHHKYHSRTTWELAYVNELEGSQHEPYVLTHIQIAKAEEATT